MQNSKVIEINGIFLGAAVCLPRAEGWRFVAADDRVSPVDGQITATLDDAQNLARQAFLRAKTSTVALPPLAL